MLVKDRMSKPVITIRPETSLPEAVQLMKSENIRRLPVVERDGHLVGIVSESDLLHASPSDATSLSIWELNYLISRVSIEELMNREVITVTEDTPLEEAARVMADKKIGGLPVVTDGEVVGMITETDLFKIFLEMLGARDKGLRVAALIKNVPGELAKVSKAIFDLGGNILALGTFLGETTENRELVFKVEGVEEQALREAISPLVEKVRDVRMASLT